MCCYTCQSQTQTFSVYCWSWPARCLYRLQAIPTGREQQNSVVSVTAVGPWNYEMMSVGRSQVMATAGRNAGLRRSEHIWEALVSFYWLRAPERIKFKLAVVVYRALHCTAPQHLSGRLQYVADLPTRRRGRLRSSTSSRRSLFCCCWPMTLTQSTWRRPVCPITHNLSSETENTFISAIIPRHCSLAVSP